MSAMEVEGRRKFSVTITWATLIQILVLVTTIGITFGSTESKLTDLENKLTLEHNEREQYRQKIDRIQDQLSVIQGQVLEIRQQMVDEFGPAKRK